MREMCNSVKEALCLRELDDLATLSVPIWEPSLSLSDASESSVRIMTTRNNGRIDEYHMPANQALQIFCACCSSHRERDLAVEVRSLNSHKIWILD